MTKEISRETSLEAIATRANNTHTPIRERVLEDAMPQQNVNVSRIKASGNCDSDCAQSCGNCSSCACGDNSCGSCSSCASCGCDCAENLK